MACKLKEEFASYYIKQLVDSDFGRKPKFGTFTPTSPTGPPPAATPSAPAPFASSSAFPTPSGPAPVNTPIYPTQPSGAGPKTTAYTQPSGTGPTPAAYTQPSGLGSTPAAYTQPSGIEPTPAAYTQPSGTSATPAVYTQLSGTGPTPAAYATPPVHTQPSSTGPAHAFHNPPSAINSPAAMTTTSTGHRRELSNLAKISTDEAKHSGRNDTSTFELENLWKNALNSLSKNFRMGSTGERGLCQAMRWTRWMKWDKTQDEMDETRVGVGRRGLHGFFKGPQRMFTVISIEAGDIRQDEVDEMGQSGRDGWNEKDVR